MLFDSSSKTGELKWFPNPEEKLEFREDGLKERKKYSPVDVLGFQSGKSQFVSLHNLTVYAANYALTGKTTDIRHAFGELLNNGKFKIYFVVEMGYDAIAGGLQAYPNYIFEKIENGTHYYVAFPVDIRMREKRYEQAKNALYDFFKDFPDINEKIKAWHRRDDFADIIDLVKEKK